jgi:hypothetical protein
MSNKKEKLVLIDLRHINSTKDGFKVKKIVNTVRFKINQYLNEKVVNDEILYNDDMTIEIVSNK